MLYGTAAGNLGKDAELRQAGGSTVLNFSVATTNGWGDKKQTNWVNCALWGDRGNSLAQYLKKGTSVVAVGELSTREYNGKTYLEMRVSDVKLQGGQQQQAATPHTPAQEPIHQPPADYDDDVPF